MGELHRDCSKVYNNLYGELPLAELAENCPKFKVLTIDIESLQSRLLKVCYVLLLGPVFQDFF